MAGTGRFGRILGGMAVLYGAFVLAGGTVLRGCVEERVSARLARSLDADVSIGGSSLSILRGRMVLEDVAARRDRGLDLRIGRVEAEVAGWGAVLFDRDVDRLLVRGVRMELSALALAARPRREPRPLPIGELVIEDAAIAAAPTSILPALGRVELTVRRATARNVQLSSALSWIESLAELDAQLTAPGGMGFGVRYAPGSLGLDGQVLGAKRSVQVPFRFPRLVPGAHEIDQLRGLAADLLASAGKALVSDEVRDAARKAIEGLLDRRRPDGQPPDASGK